MDRYSECVQCSVYREQIASLQAEITTHRLTVCWPFGTLVPLLILPGVIAGISNAIADSTENRYLVFAFFGCAVGILWAQIGLLASISLLHSGPRLMRFLVFAGGAALSLGLGMALANPYSVQHDDVAIVAHAGLVVTPLMMLPLLLCQFRYRWMIVPSGISVSPRPLSIMSLLWGISLIACYLALFRLVGVAWPPIARGDYMVYAALLVPLAIGGGVLTAAILPEGMQHRSPPARGKGWLASVGASIVCGAASVVAFGLMCSPSSAVEIGQYAVMPLTTLICYGAMSLGVAMLLRWQGYRLEGGNAGDEGAQSVYLSTEQVDFRP